MLRRRAPGCLAVAALTALAACSGAASTGRGEPGAAANASPATTASGAAAAGGAQPAGGPVPAGFRAQDLTFVSPDDGWLLGTAPCSSAPCTSIVRTSDGGRTWVGIPAPRADLEPNGQSGCDAGKLCVRGLRFANSSTGYAYGSSALNQAS